MHHTVVLGISSCEHRSLDAVLSSSVLRVIAAFASDPKDWDRLEHSIKLLLPLLNVGLTELESKELY